MSFRVPADQVGHPRAPRVSLGAVAVNLQSLPDEIVHGRHFCRRSVNGAQSSSWQSGTSTGVRSREYANRLALQARQRETAPRQFWDGNNVQV
jgi:hypothetical protein